MNGEASISTKCWILAGPRAGHILAKSLLHSSERTAATICWHLIYDRGSCVIIAICMGQPQGVVKSKIFPSPVVSTVLLRCSTQIEFFPPTLEPFCFRTNCPDGSHFAQMGSHFAQNTTPNPCPLLSRHRLLSVICTHKTPPTPPKNTPFPGLNLKVGKLNYSLGNLDPNWAIYLKSGQNFSRSGQKKKIHCSTDQRRPDRPTLGPVQTLVR